MHRCERVFIRPYRTYLPWGCYHAPAMSRRAIVGCPYGAEMKMSPLVCHVLPHALQQFVSVLSKLGRTDPRYFKKL